MKPTLLLPLLLAAPVYCTADSNLVDLLPSDTQIAFGIRVRSVVDSELARNLTAELKGQAAQWQTMIAMAGFDPLHDLDEVLIASTGTGKKVPTLIVARGRFDVPKLAPNAEEYHGVPLVTSNSKQAEGVYGFLDATTALAGDPEMVKAVIDRRDQPAHLDSALAAKIAGYRDRYDIWAVVNRTDAFSGLIPPTGSPAAALNSIDRFELGVSIKQGLELSASVHARTNKDLEQLTATLRFVEAMTKAQQPAASAGTKLAIENVNGTLKVVLAVSEEDLKKAIEQRQKAAMMFGARSPLPLPSHTVTAPVTTAAGQPTSAPPPRQTAAAPAVGPDTADTGVFTLPGRR